MANPAVNQNPEAIDPNQYQKLLQMLAHLQMENAHLKKELEQTNQTEQQLREILDSISDGFFSIDRGWHITYMNQQAAMQGRRQVEDLLGKVLWEAEPVLIGSPLEPVYRRVMQERQLEEVEFHSQRSGRWFQLRVYPFADGISVYSIDITERKLIEAERQRLMDEVHAQNAFLEQIVRKAPFGIAIVEGPDHRYQLVNGYYQQASAVKGELIGRTVGDVYAEVADQLVPPLDHVYQTGEIFRAADAPFTTIREQGPVEGFFTFTFLPLKNQVGAVDRIMILVADTTHQVKAMQAVQANQDRLKAIIDHAPQGIVVTDANARILLTNAAADRLYSRPIPYEESFSSHAALEICYPDGTPYDPRKLPLTRSALEGETFTNLEMSIHWPDGQVRSLLVNTGPIRDEQGSITGAVGVFQDVSDLKQAEVALRESELRLRIAKEAAQLGIYEYDLVNNKIICDARVRELWNIPPDQPITYERLEAGVHPDDRAIIQAALDQALYPEGDGKYHAEYRLINQPDGSERWIAATGLVAFHQNQAIRMTGTVQDISERKQAEKELIQLKNEAEKTVAQLQAIMDSMADGLVIADPQGNLLYHNPASLALHGFNSLEETQQPFLEIVNIWEVASLDGELLPLDQWPMSRALSGERFTDYEVWVRRTDVGKQYIGSYNGTPVFDRAGQMLFAIITFRDVTERKQAEDLLTFHASLIDNIHDSIIATDTELRITAWNKAAEVLYGYTAQEVLGKRPRDVLRSEFTEEQRTLAFQQIAENGRFPIEVTQYTKDGKRLIVEGCTVPHLDRKGKIIGYVSAGRDITERRRAEEELRHNRELLFGIIDNASAAIFAEDLDGRFILSNRYHAALMGQPQEEIIEKKQSDMQAIAAWSSEYTINNRQVIEQGQAIEFEENGPGPNGEEHTYLTVKFPLRNINGTVYGVGGISTDITERKRTEEAINHYAEQLKQLNQELESANQELEFANRELEFANRELKDFAYIASHDLQEPLRKVSKFGEMLRDHSSAVLDENELEYLDRMIDAARRMQDMINGLLDYSRISTRGNPFTQVDLEKTAREVLTDLEIRIEQTEGVVELGSLPIIEADPLQIRQLLQNLIGNALKFHQENVPPMVRIWAEDSPESAKAENCICLVIQDNGIGFEQALAARLFQPFMRLHGRSAFEGTGMGLAICRKIVERHRGTITVTSSPGKGTTFTVTLPKSQR